MISYQPKGGMCAGCKHKTKMCNMLDFSKMPVIQHDKEWTIVRCTKYKKE